ncbi:MAG: peptidoglycan-binding protein [Actinomycetota bacterium]
MSEHQTAPAPERPAPSENGHRPVDVAAALAEVDRAVNRRRWPAALLGAAVGIGGTLAVLAFLDRRDTETSAEAETVTLATAPVEQRDLIEEIEWTGTLGYGEQLTVAGSGGVVTGIVAVGTTIDRGDPVAEIDAEPIVALFGDAPLWRPLADGAEGADVRLLEANLVLLGYDPDGTVDIDTTFTANTEAMVERWQTDLGVDVSGRVDPGAVVIVEGPSVVASTPEIGAAASGPLVGLVPRRTVEDVVSGAGLVADLAPVGTPIVHGTVLYTVDDIAVPALVDDDPVVAALTDQTFTDTELEQALADAGHDPDGEMTIDGTITTATVAAIERWQAATALPITGRTEPRYYAPVAADRVVGSHLTDDGTTLATASPVLTTARSRLAIAVVVEVAEADEFEVGQAVSIELADETVVDGAVTEIGPVVPAAGGQDTPTVEITIGVTDRTGEDPVEGPVTVTSAGEVITGATVVPTRALVTLAEGGFAVERVEADGSATLIGVELGTFDDGMVEVVDGDLRPGDEVVVPQ